MPGMRGAQREGRSRALARQAVVRMARGEPQALAPSRCVRPDGGGPVVAGGGHVILCPVGYGRYYFARDPKGGLKRIAASAFDAFHFRDGALPRQLVDGDGKINVAELVVELEDRAPVRVVGATFCRYGLLKDGRFDPADRELQMQAAAHRMNDAHRSVRPGPAKDVIDAEDRFVGKRLEAASRWSPTDAELDALRELVGRRIALGELRRERREDDVAKRPVAERIDLAGRAGPDWQLRLLAGDDDIAVRAAVAANGHAPSEALEILRQDREPAVLAAVASSYHSAPDWLGRMAKHQSAAVRAAAASNVRTPDHLVARLAWADPDPVVQRHAREHIEQKLGAAVQQASSPYAAAWYLAYAARHSQAEVRLAAAANPRLPNKMIPLLAHDGDPRVKQAIATRLRIDGDPARLFCDEPPKRGRRAGRQQRLPLVR